MEHYGLIARSRKMKAVLASINKIKNNDINVLIIGETGSGKEMVARAIHHNGPRKNGPLVSVNCAAIPQGLIESELFGHEKGAFTGAYDKKAGKFELAMGGTLFMDEIGDLPLDAQAKVLRLIENKEFMRIGGNESIKVDVRIICASNKDLLQEVKGKRFRQDLYYRVTGYCIQVPPLRERKDDIPDLANEFMQGNSRDAGKVAKKLSKEAMNVLLAYPWPGNVRELQNVLVHAATLAKGNIISPEWLGPNLNTGKHIKTYKLKSVERGAIERALAKSSGNLSRAAEILGIHRVTLYRKLKKFG